MEINIKIHIEQPAPPGVYQQRSDERTNRQTDRQKTRWFWPPRNAWNPGPTKLGMVIEDLKHVLAPLKLLGVWRTAMGCWRFGCAGNTGRKKILAPSQNFVGLYLRN